MHTQVLIDPRSIIERARFPDITLSQTFDLERVQLNQKWLLQRLALTNVIVFEVADPALSSFTCASLA